MAIENLTINDTVTSSTRIAVSINGVDNSVLASTLLTYIENNIAFPEAMVTQYTSPPGEDYNSVVTDSSASIFLVVSADIGHATATITLPSLSNCVDGQEILVFYKSSVTTLTILGNGAIVAGAPSTVGYNDYFRLRFAPLYNTWYRVG